MQVMFGNITFCFQSRKRVINEANVCVFVCVVMCVCVRACVRACVLALSVYACVTRKRFARKLLKSLSSNGWQRLCTACNQIEDEINFLDKCNINK